MCTNVASFVRRVLWILVYSFFTRVAPVSLSHDNPSYICIYICNMGPSKDASSLLIYVYITYIYIYDIYIHIWLCANHRWPKGSD